MSKGGAVSYTHLDVYKRQPHFHALPSALPHILSYLSVFLFTSRSTHIGCSVFTEDVYKRQVLNISLSLPCWDLQILWRTTYKSSIPFLIYTTLGHLTSLVCTGKHFFNFFFSFAFLYYVVLLWVIICWLFFLLDPTVVHERQEAGLSLIHI